MNGQNEHMTNEEDIGSGEKAPGQQDTEKIIEQVGKKGQSAADSNKKTPDSRKEDGAKG